MRRMKTISAVIAAASLAMVGLGATAANAGTGVTFTISAGSISITQPSAVADLGTVTSNPTGTTTSGKLGTTTVIDNRGSLAGWTSTIASSDFTDGATPLHTILASKAAAYVLPTDGPSLLSGVAVVSTTHVASASALTLANTAGAFVTAATTGNNSASFNPTVAITIDSTVISGTYTGTVTQTVS